LIAFILLVLFIGLFTVGLFFLISGVLGLPPLASIRAIERLTVQEISFRERMLFAAARHIEPFVHLSPYRKELMIGDLESAGDSDTPEMYYAKAIASAGFFFLVGLLFLPVYPPFSPIGTAVIKRPDELPRMKFGEIIVIRQRCYPIHTKITPFYKLKLPVKLIRDIIPKSAPVPLRELLLPVSSFIKAFYQKAEEAAENSRKAAAAKKEGVQEKNEIKEAKIDDKEKMKLQGAINNINLLTKNACKKGSSSDK
jgi:hypothetical protein